MRPEALTGGRPRQRPPAAPRDLEMAAWASGLRVVAGVDEAGRGALAGPVVAAAVILAPETDLPYVTDSKLLTPTDREELYAALTAAAVSWAVGLVGPEDIDRLNILQATHRAMRKAMQALTPAPDLVLIDGLPLPDCPYPQQNVIKGDRRSQLIAAASIIAKVTRDRLMVEMDATFPQYGFAGHKGYAAPVHLQALVEHGPCPVHRLSFAPCRTSGQGRLFADS